ncbi:hypothetical protein H6S82_11945 [Planktothrix sp. FACHB-1355]|uniref:Uncharacterized protein n=1 Tax=Aerosakkonema funiforme FACHB-1375 TaxID=2949571 RepID=A0A926ZFT7_9CYAN|nr:MULTISPECIES: hypothetical protein [Oscillatoriales]MBD2181014.1 hypothetical protein [Aerosakkonema funiforme FACHB-1375]MBD3559571.1 hypothetical protein [Planktothrix sp. FACHB-1355]
MRKDLFLHSQTLITIIGTSSLLLSVSINPVRAATGDTPETQQISQIASDEADSFLSAHQVSNEIQGFIKDVRSFVQGDLFGGITQLVQNAVGAVQIPDIGQVVSQIMKGSLPEDASFATKLENNVSNSYAIRQDAAQMSERVGALQVAQTQTLSKTAQDKSKATIDYSAASATESEQMARDSQNTDTSQQILQNISNQLKNSADIANLQMLEASQARQDRALQLTLTAQAARELNAANIRERQSAISSGNAATAQSGLLTMPGGAVLGQDSTISSNP